MTARIISMNPNIYKIIINNHALEGIRKRGVFPFSEMDDEECKISLKERLKNAQILPSTHSFYDNKIFQKGASLIHPRLIKVDKKGTSFRCVYAVKRNKNRLTERLLCVYDFYQLIQDNIACLEEITTIRQ